MAKPPRTLSRTLASWRASIARARARVPAEDRAAGDTACRNCGADAPGAFCPACGQETALRLPNAGRFMREAAGRYVAFDGTMWRTLAALLLRPGFLTREYLAGRRKRYVRPARLVLVLALVLFAAIRMFADPDDVVHLSMDEPASRPAVKGAAANDASRAAPKATGANAPAASRAGKEGAFIEFDGEPMTIGTEGAGLAIDEDFNVRLNAGTVLGARLGKRLDSFNRLDRAEKAREIVAGMLRYGPYALIALLPAFALLMQVLYLGRARRYPDRPRRYAEHLVFAAHNHAFIALIGTLAVAIPFRPAVVALVLWSAVYLPVSMRVAYRGRWIGVIARAFVASIAYAFLFALAVGGLFIAAVVLR